MNLHDRLEAAKAQRRQRAGLPAEEPEASPMHKPIGEGARRDQGTTSTIPAAGDGLEIDLTGYAPVVDLRPELLSRDAAPSFAGALAVGEGDNCPNCATGGRLDMEDVVGGVDHYSCPNCGLLFQVAR